MTETKGKSITDPWKDAEWSRLEDFAATSPGWFWETDAEHRFVYLSSNILEIIGFRPEWHYGKTREEIAVTDAISEAKWRDHLGQLDRHQPFADFVYERTGPRGSKWIRSSGKPIFGSSGEFLGYRGTAVDITGQEFAARSADRLLEAVEHLDALFMLWDADDRLVVGNKKFREKNRKVIESIKPGITFEDHLRVGIGADLIRSAQPNKEDWIAERVRQHQNPGEPVEIERLPGKWLLVHEKKLSGGFISTCSIDISAQKKAELERAKTVALLEEAHQKLLDTEARANATLSAMREGVVMHDRDGAIVLSNPAAAEILGLTEDQLAGRSSIDPQWKSVREDGTVFPGEEHPAMVSLKTGVPQRDVVMGIHKADGSDSWILINSVPVFTNDSETPAAVIATFQDITLRRRHEQVLAEQSEKLRKYAYHASHDLRAPLRKICMLIDVLESDLADAGIDDFRPQTRHIHEVAHRGNILVSDVLRYASLTNSPPKRSWFAVRDLLSETLAEIGLDLDCVETDLSIDQLCADRSLIRICFSNLLENAAKYRNPQRPLSIRISSRYIEDIQMHRILVADNGIGFDKMYKDRIFEPFTRLVSKSDYDGSGIGLSFVRDILIAHGWSIDADSEPGSGSVFSISIPDRDVRSSA